MAAVYFLCSINQKGLKFLTSRPDLMRVLVWLLQGLASSWYLT